MGKTCSITGEMKNNTTFLCIYVCVCVCEFILCNMFHHTVHSRSVYSGKMKHVYN